MTWMFVMSPMISNIRVNRDARQRRGELALQLSATRRPCGQPTGAADRRQRWIDQLKVRGVEGGRSPSLPLVACFTQAASMASAMCCGWKNTGKNSEGILPLAIRPSEEHPEERRGRVSRSSGRSSVDEAEVTLTG